MNNNTVNNQFPNYVPIAKFIKMLTTCGKLQDLAFIKLVKKHEKNKTVCAKYFYEIYLKLNKNDQANKYTLSHVDISFLDNFDMSSMQNSGGETFARRTAQDILKQYNGNIAATKATMAATFELHDPYYSSFLALIYKYLDSPYNYLLLPIIVDYSMDTGLVHQCALIVDLHAGIFLFYEPYGQYTKYKAEYKSAIGEFLNLYEFPNKFYSGGQLSYFTWHEYFDLHDGIQSILLRAHNEKKIQYEQDKDIFLQNMTKYPIEHAKLIDTIAASNHLPIHNDDYTYDTLIIADHFCTSNFSKHLENEALLLYYKYNSKTCVTITITELDYFFSMTTINKSTASKNLQQYYDEFKLQTNYKLFERASEFINMGSNSSHEKSRDNISARSPLLDILDAPLKLICKKISE